MTHMRICSICGVSKPKSQYHNRVAGGVETYCKPCHAKKDADNHIKRTAAQKQANASHPIVDRGSYCMLQWLWVEPGSLAGTVR